MGLGSVAPMGATPIGGRIAGAVAAHFGRPPGPLEAAVCFAAAILGTLLVRRQSPRRPADRD